jgi:uncharacterized protein (TIGR02271 family)
VATRSATPTGTEEVVPVYEEQLRVGERDVSHGRMRIRSYVVETPVNEQVSLRRESVQVERKPVDRRRGGRCIVPGRVIEAEERAEEAVVGKETRVKEELTLRKTTDDPMQDIRDTVRHTEVEIEDERGGRNLAGTATDFGGQIAEHMDVIASDGIKIGTVDHLDGPDKISSPRARLPTGSIIIPLTGSIMSTRRSIWPGPAPKPGPHGDPRPRHPPSEMSDHKPLSEGDPTVPLLEGRASIAHNRDLPYP